MKSHTKAFLVLFVLVIAGISGAALRNESQEKKASGDADGPTPITLGVMTERQRQHSRLYENRVSGKRKLQESRGPVELVIQPPWVEDPNEKSAQSLEEFFQNAACNADAVVLGVIRNKTSQLTEEGSFVFTDYEMEVDEVLKNNEKAPIQLNSLLAITRPGGAVILNGKTIRVTDRSYKLPQIGHRYLLFVRFVPATATYQPLDSESSFELAENKIKRLSERQLSYKFNCEDAASFVALASTVLAKCPRRQT